MDAETAFLVKGVGAVIALILLLWHMFTTDGHMSFARAMRYLALLTAAGAVAFASQEQARMHTVWNSRQWGGVCIIVTVILCSIASLMEDRGITLRRRKDRP